MTLATAALVGIALVMDLLAIAQFEGAADPVAAWVDAPESLITNLSGAVVGYFLQGIFTFIVLQHLRGKSPGALDALGTGLARTVRAIPTALAAAFVIGGLMFLGNWIGAFATIPAIIVGCGWFVAVPVAATEGLGVMDALGRSWAPTKGSKGRILLVQFVFGILGFGLAFFLFFRMIDAGETATFEDLRRTVLLMHVVTLPTISLMALAAPVSYYFLRTGKEGIDVEEIASVFD